jgi:adhesin/invasin
LAVTGTGNSITQPAGTTNAAGQITGSWSSTQAANKTVSATITGSGAMTATDVVTVNPDVAAAAQTLIAVDDAAIQASNTGSAAGFRSVVTVTVMDQFGNVRAGDIIVFTPSDADDFWRLSTASATATNTDTTDASGVASRVFFSTLAQGKTLTADIGAFNETIGVTVSAAAPSSVIVNGGNSQTARVGFAVTTDPSFLVRDAFLNPVSGQLVSFSAAGGGLVSPASASTNASGIVTVTSWSMGSTGTENANGTFTNTLTADAGTPSVNATGFGIYTYSGDVAPLIGTSSGCEGCHYASWTRANIVNVGDADPAGYASCVGWLLVDDGNANNSLIYRKTAANPGQPCGGAMPGAAGLAAASRTIIRAWINNGALNN